MVLHRNPGQDHKSKPITGLICEPYLKPILLDGLKKQIHLCLIEDALAGLFIVFFSFQNLDDNVVLGDDDTEAYDRKNNIKSNNKV